MQIYKFYKNNCPGCYTLGRNLTILEKDISSQYEIISKNVEDDDNKELARSYGLSSVPALVRVHDNKMLVGGSHSRDVILQFFKEE